MGRYGDKSIEEAISDLEYYTYGIIENIDNKALKRYRASDDPYVWSLSVHNEFLSGIPPDNTSVYIGTRLPMLKKFINDENIATINFDVTNDYFSDLSSECLKYHMFTESLSYLSTFVNTTPEEFSLQDMVDDVEGWKIEFQYFTDKSCMAFVSMGRGTYAELVTAKGKISFNVASDDINKIHQVREIADKLFPIIHVSKTEDTVPVAFWSAGMQGPISRQKKILPLKWDEVNRNYTGVTRELINSLIEIRPPVEGGRLILWHGPVGTGKSSAIRALIHAWLPWCNTSYVVDPEQFFGSANYMLSVLLDQKSGGEDFIFDIDVEEEVNKPLFVLQRHERWNLLIVEDADEFLRADSKDRVGQALSRLLNLADGLIGQGLNFLVLITTNEAMPNIHKAIQREGRCLSVVEFPNLSRQEARKWLTNDSASACLNRLKYREKNEFSLAQLYDMRREAQQQIREVEKEVSTGVYL